MARNFAIGVEVRFLRIPVEWRLKNAVKPRIEDTDGNEIYPEREELAAVPSILDQPCTRIDGWYLRDRFFKLRGDPESTIEFLNEVGVWKAVSDPYVTGTSADILSGVFGTRYFNGRALPVSLEEIIAEQKSWRELMLSGPSAALPPAPRATARPIDKLRFAADAKFRNEMPLRTEWEDGLPVGIIETIMGSEMLTATMHLEFLQAARYKPCKRPDCGVPFAVSPTNKNKTYCSQYCGHLESVRKGRRKGRRHAKKR